MSIKVSVIVPVYNTSVYLQKCLDSLCSQTLHDIEIICVDDGSTDNSGEILEEYKQKDTRIKVITQTNQGQSSARNAGLAIAQGEYTGFLDSDDFAKPNMFEKLYNNARKFDSDISVCSIEIFDENTLQTYCDNSYMSLSVFGKEFENRVFSPQETYEFLFKICVVPWNKIYKSEFLKKNSLKFVENLNFEDNVFFIDAYTSSKKVSLINEELVVYRLNSATSYSTAKKSHDAKKLDFFKIYDLEEQILKKKGLFKQLKENFLWEKTNNLIYWYNKILDKDIKEVYKKRLKRLYPQIYFLRILKFINKKIVSYKLNKLTKKHTVVFWGASLFLQDFLSNKKNHNKNILAVVDKDNQKYGKTVGPYKILPPEKLSEIKPDYVIPSAINWYKFENTVKKELKKLNINIPVCPKIFQSTNIMAAIRIEYNFKNFDRD